MKKKLFLGFALIASLSFTFFALEENNSSIFKASLLEESPKEASAQEWKKALEENDFDFIKKTSLLKKQDTKNQEKIQKFLESNPLKIDISVKKTEEGNIFFSFFGVNKNSKNSENSKKQENTSAVLSDNNYAYMGENFSYISPQGTFSQDESNTLLLTNTSVFPLFLDGEYLALSKNGEESEVSLISLAESEKDYILPDELFTLEPENSDIFQIESIKYGFTLTLQK